jgi:hypothetical protein
VEVDKTSARPVRLVGCCLTDFEHANRMASGKKSQKYQQMPMDMALKAGEYERPEGPKPTAM